MNFKNLKNIFTKVKFNSKEKIDFLEQFSNLINSGIPIINSLKIIIYQSKKKKVKIFLENVISDLNKGGDLKSSFEKYPQIFNFFDLSIIEMGELTGSLSESIETIRKKEAKEKELKSKIIGALIYPIIIVILSTGMVGVFMVYVIPKIQKMYSDSKVNLPELTQKVIAISDFIQKNVSFIVVGIFIFFSFIIIFKKYKKTKIYWDYFTLRIPFFGKLIKIKNLSLFSANLGILLKNGIMINKSIEISSKSIGNDYYEKKLEEINKRVSKGLQLSELMGINEIQTGKENFLFPIDLASNVKIGEETGNMAELLINISKKYTKEINNLVKNIQIAIEPTVIVIIGIVVGTLIMAILLPFFNMVNVV